MAWSPRAMDLLHAVCILEAAGFGPALTGLLQDWVSFQMSDKRPVGYIEILREYPTYRRYFVANAISMLGTWFSAIALFTLAPVVSERPELTIGVLMVLQMVALAFPQPFTGMLADRFNRKWLMVISEVAAALVVLALMTIRGPEDIYLYYGGAALLMMLHALYLPAESAALPNIVPDEQALLTANAMNSATWSSCMAIGAALGGFVVAGYGTDVAFVVDSATFVLSALIIVSLDIPQEGLNRATRNAQNGFRMIVEGFRRIRQTPPVYRILSAKALWALGGGGLVYCLVMLGEELGLGEVAAGIGVVYAVRGLGSGLGPLVARFLLRDPVRWPFYLGALVSLSGVFYLGVGTMPWSVWVLGFVLAAHAASGANWVLSTVILQNRTTDEWRGRVFATDFLLMTLVNGLSSLLASLLLAYGFFELRSLILFFAGLQVFVGILWLVLTLPGERREQALQAQAP